MTDEQREKIRLVAIARIKSGTFGFKKGYKASETHLKRLSDNHIGQKAWNKGKKETREKVLENMKLSKLGIKKPWSEEGRRSFKEKMSGNNNPRWIEDRTQIDLNKRRNWSTECIEWRESVFARDGHKCMIGGKDCVPTIQAHHILPWRDHPEERFNINNGITLCLACHPRKRSEEKRLESYFMELGSVSKAPQL